MDGTYVAEHRDDAWLNGRAGYHVSCFGAAVSAAAIAPAAAAAAISRSHRRHVRLEAASVAELVAQHFTIEFRRIPSGLDRLRRFWRGRHRRAGKPGC
jgi:hypothetical protein